MPGRSVGSPTNGHLVGGAHLAEAPHLRIVPSYAAGDARWGLESLVSMIDHTARAVRKQFPDAVLSVGHLSRPGGGEIDRHASHESGRDADVGFYVKNHEGKPVYADHFVPFRGDGTAPTWPGAHFDDARNWAFVASVAGDVQAHVTHIFVASPLRARLLQYAEKIGAPAALRSRAAELMAQPKGALPHDDHFHLRIACPAGMDKCVEQPTPRRSAHGALAHWQGAPSGRPGGGGPPSGKAPPGQAPPAHGAASASKTSAASPQVHGAAPSSKTPAAPPPVRGAAPSSKPPAAPPKATDKAESEASRREPLVPSLAPVVPGLDSVVIPAPLAGPRPEKPEDVPAPSDLAPIDDPDGVLESR